MDKEFSRVFIKNRIGELLIIKDRKRAWNFPGGKRELGETAEACAIREIEEEIGVTVYELERIYSGQFEFDGVMWTGHFYFAQAVCGVPILKEPDKISKLKFVRKIEMFTFSTGIQPLLDDLLEKKVLDNKVTVWLA